MMVLKTRIEGRLEVISLTWEDKIPSALLASTPTLMEDSIVMVVVPTAAIGKTIDEAMEMAETATTA